MRSIKLEHEKAQILDKIIQSDFRPVYKRNPTVANPRGQSNIGEAQEKVGVYIILEKTNQDKTGSIVYVGQSSYDLHHTIMRHFQAWKDKDQKNRISYRNRILKNTHQYEIAIAYTTAKTAKLVERELILMYAPRDNKEKLAYYEQTPDDKVLQEYMKYLEIQYQRRRNVILRVLRNPDKFRNKDGKINWQQQQKYRAKLKKIDEQIKNL